VSERRIWVWAEVSGDDAHRLSLELLTPARSLGTAEAVLLHPGSSSIVEALGNHGATKILHGAASEYAEYLTEPHAATLAQLIEQEQPSLVLFPSTPSARDVLARLMGKMGVGVVANATDVAYDASGQINVTVPYGAETIGSLTLDGHGPHLVQVRPKAFAAEEVGGMADVQLVDTAIDPGTLRVKVVENVEQPSQGPNLEDAAIIVSGGRGLGKPENFALIEALAQRLGGAAGATRAIVDAGWVPYSYQVGQTGKTVKPTLYVACGISGAIQHVAGMRGSKYTIAINRDPDAAIFDMADLGVVGDVMTILPRLTERLGGR
jgi:electron transfer flavoprotein alpha subunit